MGLEPSLWMVQSAPPRRNARTPVPECRPQEASNGRIQPSRSSAGAQRLVSIAAMEGWVVYGYGCACVIAAIVVGRREEAQGVRREFRRYCSGVANWAGVKMKRRHPRPAAWGIGRRGADIRCGGAIDERD